MEVSEMNQRYEAWKQEHIDNGSWDDRAPRFLIGYSRTANRDPNPRIPFVDTDPLPYVTKGEAFWAVVIAAVVVVLVSGVAS